MTDTDTDLPRRRPVPVPMSGRRTQDAGQNVCCRFGRQRNMEWDGKGVVHLRRRDSS